uniref:Uncharacterized protein n=3 Tax=Oryza TaxID=4527 RepID=Q10JH2_ORYSJ|nr:hypothetical protein [Oryza sativa Japonica Group]ABF96659.1 hypothetical protein LOC_Os03g30670 [Oryza sativa Japonica Group]
MAHLRLLLSHSSRHHPQPHRLLSLLHFFSNTGSGSGPTPPPIKPVSYVPKPQLVPEEAPAAAEEAAPSDDPRVLALAASKEIAGAAAAAAVDAGGDAVREGCGALDHTGVVPGQGRAAAG